MKIKEGNLIDKELIFDLVSQAQKEGIKKFVVGAVIERVKNHCLLLKRAQDDFMGGLMELPSGTVDESEDLLEALFREVKEETGLEITKIVSYLGFFDYLSSSGKKTRQFSFKVSTTKDAVCLSKEHSLFMDVLIHSAEFQNLNISPETKKVILTAYQK